MCLAVPAQIVDISQDGNHATVNLNGVTVDISLALVDDVCVHDYVLVHVGFALNKIDQAEAEKTIALFSEAGLLP